MTLPQRGRIKKSPKSVLTPGNEFEKGRSMMQVRQKLKTEGIAPETPNKKKKKKPLHVALVRGEDLQPKWTTDSIGGGFHESEWAKKKRPLTIRNQKKGFPHREKTPNPSAWGKTKRNRNPKSREYSTTSFKNL